MAFWSKIATSLKQLWKPSPYGDAPRGGFRVRVAGNLDIDKNGVKEIVSAEGAVYVSRHGLQLLGVTCPRCGFKAAKPGEWEKVHQSRWGECVNCFGCGRALYASPNDDEGDPPPPPKGVKLDPKYYLFVRPEGWEPPRQRTTTDKLKVDDWIVIENYIVPAETSSDPAAAHKPERNLDRQEGKVLSLTEDTVEVALGGNVGLGGERSMGANIVTIPIKHVFAMVLPRYRVGDPVRVNQGVHMDRTGTLLWSEHARVSVKLTDLDIAVELPLFHIDRIISNERPH